MFSNSKHTETSFFRRYIPIRGSYSMHRCLELEIWRFSWRQQTDKTDCFTPWACARGNIHSAIPRLITRMHRYRESLTLGGANLMQIQTEHSISFPVCHMAGLRIDHNNYSECFTKDVYLCIRARIIINY